MPFRFFAIPIHDSGEAAEELNAFLRSRKVLSVDRRWVDQGASSFWSFCVDYLDAIAASDGSFRTQRQHSLILPITEPILERAADLWVAARLGGHPGRDADLIIAATALEHGRVLVTGNTPHFAWIPGLKLANWREP